MTQHGNVNSSAVKPNRICRTVRVDCPHGLLPKNLILTAGSIQKLAQLKLIGCYLRAVQVRFNCINSYTEKLLKHVN